MQVDDLFSGRREWLCVVFLTRRRGFFLISVTCARVICRQFPPHGGVSSDRKECTELGVQLLRDGGSAVDAAVGAVLCLGVLQPRRAGLGGSVALLPCLLSVNSVRPIPCWRPIPDTIGCSCTDTDTNSGNDVTYSLGHAYIAHVVHSVCTFQNIMSLTLCFQTNVRNAYDGIAY